MNTTLFIRITGQVQGVGFRPFVYQQAVKYGLKGWVNNSLEGVHIEVTGPPASLDAFTRALQEEKPTVSHIGSISVEPRDLKSFSAFEIVKSNREGEGQLVLTPDLALCRSCAIEMFDSQNRRFLYPFITCNYCGPRYSIIKGLPYDREQTSMYAYSMCHACRKEYDDPANWRFFSQTNSCECCGINMELYDSSLQVVHTDSFDCICKVQNALQNGQIVAVKGIGGYLLLCDACNPDAVARLRLRKKRARKPFAIMYPDVYTAEDDVVLTEAHISLLESPAAPIVLADIRPDRQFPLCLDLLAPGLDQLGVMIPYAPLFYHILTGLHKPLVATSANLSSSPIVYNERSAFRDLVNLADLLLVHDRKIYMPQDDSVMRLTKVFQKPVVLRRSRGLAPAFTHPPFEGMKETVLAMGADMKSAFGFLFRTYPYISQYFGDLDSYDTQERFQHAIKHFLGLFDANPEVVLVDKHPLYFSTQLGKEMAKELGLPVVEVQHHIAHFASVLEENQLLREEEPVLGVIWDGTGYGDGRQVWGGEFFRYEKGTFDRCCHLAYFSSILGDKMAREPRISALSATSGMPGAEELLMPLFQPSEWANFQKLLARPGLVQTSSMGRLFDAVTALTGLLPVSEYEGEAPLYLEQRARRWFDREGMDFDECYPQDDWEGDSVPVRALLKGVVDDVRSGEPMEKTAAKFHNTLIRMVEIISGKMGIQRLAFSGGVFQNELLVDLLIHRLDHKRQLYFHKQLSPNDECIAFGQIAWHYLQKVTLPSKKRADEVLK